MAATVASVVIFLSGVMVGRQVRAERAAMTGEPPVEESLTADVAAKPPTVPLNDATVDPKTPPPAPIDDLSYPQRLDPQNPPPDKLVANAKPAATPAVEPAKAPDAVSAAAARTPAAASAKPAPPPTPAASPVSAPAAEPPAAATGTPGSGFAVQVAALNVRSEADAIARRLTAKGYPAFVQTPGNAANVFRVRIGTYKTRREADAVAAKLQKEEQFKPWVTR